MEELNTTLSVEVFDEDGMDALTVIDMGDTVAISQVDDTGKLHDIIVGPAQLKRLAEFYTRTFQN